MFTKLFGLLSSEPDATDVSHHDRIQVAVAVLLLEMAHADQVFEPLEQQLVSDQLQHRFELTPDAATELIDAADQVRRESLDVQQFTRLINSNFSAAEKLEVMEVLWRIVYSDGQLDRFEDALARQLAGLLHLSSRETIALKVKVLDELNPERNR